MAEYVTTFTKPYPSGYQDLPSEATPVGHEIIESWENAIVSLESYLSENNIPEVSANTTVKSGTKIATITIDGTEYVIYSPGVSYESAITGGTKVGTITVGANTFDVYAPTSSAGGSTVSVVPKTLTGTNIAEITVDGTTYQLYAPTSGGSGSTVTAEAILTEGTQIGKITIDGVETILYAPTASPITVDSELSATSINPVQNKAIAEEFQKYANGTKVVAKATESDTAKTASNSEKVNGHTVGTDVPSNAVFTDTVYDDSTVKASIQNIVNGTTQVGSATKATQDAQGNVIDTTYAKKTEVPQGTVVDDALSSTSTNPVQNKVVKAEFDQVNSNLDGLGYGENGAYNLINPTLQTTTIAGITCTSNGDGIYTLNGSTEEYPAFRLADVYLEKGTYLIDSFSYDGNNPYLWVGKDGENNNIINQFWTQPLTFTLDSKTLVSIHMVCVSGQNFSDKLMFPMLIKGTSAQKQYKPYIPSVKMLADENAQQSTEIMDIKILGWSVPSECPIQNEVNGNTFIQKVGRVDLGELYWSYGTYSGNNLFDASLPLNTVNATTNMYFTNSFVADGLNGWATLPNNHCRAYSSGIRIKDTSYTDATAFKTAMKGVYLYYELATPITMTIDGNEVVTKVNSNLGCLEFNGWTIPNDMPLKDASLVDKVDMGSLTWNYISSGQFFYADLAGGKIGSKNAYCSRYNLSNSSSYGGMANKEFMLSVSSETVSRVFLKDTTYTDATVLKNSLNGQYLYFERVTAKTFTDGQNAIDELKNDLNVVFKTREIDAPRCVLTDNKNVITSDYGYSYSDITNMLTNGDWRKYIKNGDYIRLTTLNNEVFNLIFNINTYKDYGDTSVGSHIDLISEHLIPSSQGWQMRTENTNNGTSDIPNPFLASTNMINKLSTYFTNNIPDGLKSHIVTKRLLVPKRYSDNGTLTDDNNWEWKDLGKMWLPFEQEVAGRQVWGSREWQGGLRWYPCFQDGTQITKKLRENGDRYFWWTASAYSGNSTYFVFVLDNGGINGHNASDAWLAVPLCMRFK